MNLKFSLTVLAIGSAVLIVMSLGLGVFPRAFAGTPHGSLVAQAEQPDSRLSLNTPTQSGGDEGQQPGKKVLVPIQTGKGGPQAQLEWDIYGLQNQVKTLRKQLVTLQASQHTLDAEVAALQAMQKTLQAQFAQHYHTVSIAHQGGRCGMVDNFNLTSTAGTQYNVDLIIHKRCAGRETDQLPDYTEVDKSTPPILGQ